MLHENESFWFGDYLILDFNDRVSVISEGQTWWSTNQHDDTRTKTQTQRNQKSKPKKQIRKKKARAHHHHHHHQQSTNMSDDEDAMGGGEGGVFDTQDEEQVGGEENDTEMQQDDEDALDVTGEREGSGGPDVTVVGIGDDNYSTGPGTARSERITTKYLTKYERARVLGTRALQISMNAPVMVVRMINIHCFRSFQTRILYIERTME